MNLLCDSNVFLALTLDTHPHHSRAVAWIETLPEGVTALFCRATQLAFLRLLTVEPILKVEVRSNEEALAALDKLQSDSRIGFMANEPAGLEARWFKLARHASPAPKRWMDAYLASFAICAKMRFVTFDRGFEQFVPLGLDLILLGQKGEK
ncbi:MAG: PIN domain-containing protein [Candidatus Omnitrophica bacterium]|nr:PIN domain-containing protein [Candidatus Omnitrophota bacterium]